ncbi:MAG TPA: carboxylating nicotinate-nucleotide diphosphorylase [Micavibrio sp.]|nr:carboxylating nicotinate-nucleotide diphosphorylase [Micavibrio sp.]HIL29744.1 carboxylating nicotinate-nucleotide diphosphorylase [Micavibrio sp.]
MTIFSFAHQDIVKAALLEDLGRGHDLTSQGVLPPDMNVKTEVVARQTGIVAGTELARIAFSMIDEATQCHTALQDGSVVKKGDVIMTITGKAPSVLSAERTALNFITHLSGIASETARYVAAAEGTKAAITCTRKTLPGLRAVQKYAVKVGGGKNHRFGLDDGILIKDNHIAACGSISKAVANARKYAGHMICVEVEVDTLEQLEEVLDTAANAVLLDNMNLEMMTKAVDMVDERMLVEASGGIKLDKIQDIAKTGVDLISVGALTHSAVSLDLGLDFKA